MTQITLYPFIWTRVEIGYSAERSSGYQFIYRSSGLSREEIAETKQIVQSFYVTTMGKGTPTRTQFYVLNTGKVLVAKTTVIDTDPVIMDKTGRPGIFLTHGWLIEPDDFARINNDPFLILDNVKFISSTDELRQAITKYGTARGEISPEQHNITAISRRPNSAWLSGDAKDWGRLAQHVGKMRNESKQVFLIGSQDEIMEALRTALSAAGRQRLLCTFNSNVDRTSVAGMRYWALGMSERSGRSDGFEVQTATRLITFPPDFLSQDNPLVQQWVDALTRQGMREEEIDTMRPTASLLSEHLESQTPFTPLESEEIEYNREAAISYMQVHKQRLLKRIDNALKLHLHHREAQRHKRIIKVVQDYIFRHLTPENAISIAVQGRIKRKELAWLIGQILSNKDVHTQSIDLTDWDFLVRLGKDSEDWQLVFWASAFGTKKERGERNRALQAMNAEQYRAALSKLNQPFPPSIYIGDKGVGTQYLPLLLEAIHIPGDLQVRETLMTDLIKKLIQVDQVEKLADAAGYIAGYPPEVRDRLRALLPRTALLPLVLEKAFQGAFPNLDQPPIRLSPMRQETETPDISNSPEPAQSEITQRNQTVAATPEPIQPIGDQQEDEFNTYGGHKELPENPPTAQTLNDTPTDWDNAAGTSPTTKGKKAEDHWKPSSKG